VLEALVLCPAARHKPSLQILGNDSERLVGKYGDALLTVKVHSSSNDDHAPDCCLLHASRTKSRFL
jgi:hypothetical protein